MELDRRKHDVDVIERVLGHINESPDANDGARIVDVVPEGPSTSPVVELTVRLENEPPSRNPPD